MSRAASNSENGKRFKLTSDGWAVLTALAVPHRSHHPGAMVVAYDAIGGERR